MNLNEMQDRIRGTVLAGLVGLAVLLFILDSTGNLDNVFNFLQNPTARVLDWTSSGVDPIADALTGPRTLQEAQQEIENLRAQVDALSRENEELRELQGQYQLLRDLFDHARQTPDYRRVMANVIARDTSPFRRSIIIDRGINDGVFVGMPVESARGLVGRVYRATANSSQIILVNDSVSEVPARLSTSRATGIVRGGGLGGAMRIEWVDLEVTIERGEVILTSGIGGRFPPDLVIGRVIDVERREASLHQRAFIQPAVDFDALEIVFVITSFRPVDPTIFDNPDGEP